MAVVDHSTRTIPSKINDHSGWVLFGYAVFTAIAIGALIYFMSAVTWSWWQTALVVGLFGVSITIFVAGVAGPNSTRPRAEHRTQSRTRARP